MPAICFTIANFPHLETIVVDDIILVTFLYPYKLFSARIDDSPHSHSHSQLFLEGTWEELIKIFTRLHFPILQRLTVVGVLEQLRVGCLLARLHLSRCRR